MTMIYPSSLLLSVLLSPLISSVSIIVVEGWSLPFLTKSKRYTTITTSKVTTTSLLAVRSPPPSSDAEEQAASPVAGKNFVWIWDQEAEYDEDNSSVIPDGEWRRPLPSMHETSRLPRAMVAEIAEIPPLRTQNWSRHFVQKLDLCPWAKASLDMEGAMRFFLVPPLKTKEPTLDDNEVLANMRAQAEETRNGRIVKNVAQKFQSEILLNHDKVDADVDPDPAVLERAAIYFLIFLSDRDIEDEINHSSALEYSPANNFVDFIHWFMELEDAWPEELDDVIIAPFHPNWEFAEEDNVIGNDENSPLNYEKRSPYPLVSLVSTRVVERAGEAVTLSIGEHNREHLSFIEDTRHTTSGRVASMWHTAIYGHSNNDH